MSPGSEPVAGDVTAELADRAQRERLRILTCGSVDDGKSTLIGRLLLDSKLLYEDQLAAVEHASRRHGTTGGAFDPALVTDGLKAEREQGITIDVAYRYFSTSRRSFIVADTPGHEQYTRNMATGASNCDLAIILVDAVHGVANQTRRHGFIAALLGIRHIVVAINKMDLVDYSEAVFSAIRSEFADFAARLEIDDIHFVPISALHGDNVVDASPRLPWYRGTTLMHLLENIHISSDRNLIDFRMPVQYVNRPSAEFRGYCGTVASGIVRPGDEVMVLPSRRTSRVRSVVTYDGERPEAFPPLAITLTLEDEIDVSRGDVLVHPGNLPHLADGFEAVVVWMAEQPLVAGKRYLIKHLATTAVGWITALRYQIDVDSLHRIDADALGLNQIGRCEMRLNRPVAFDSYKSNRATGAFIIIDRASNRTVGAGMILERPTSADRHDHWETPPSSPALKRQSSRVRQAETQARLGQRPVTVLLTGISGSGKSTIGYALERRLFELGRASCVLDGQNLRLGISRDLGFSEEDRSEAVRRAAEIAKIVNDAGLICLCAYVAPREAVRRSAREVIGDDRFLLVHLAAPVEICRARDPEDRYRLADGGEIAYLPGVTTPYEEPDTPDLTLRTDELSVAECVERIVELLRGRGIFA